MVGTKNTRVSLTKNETILPFPIARKSNYKIV